MTKEEEQFTISCNKTKSLEYFLKIMNISEENLWI